jgi:DNA polymerase
LIDPRERVLLCDFESRSRADLKRVGGRNYWEHPTSETIVAVWHDTAPPTGRDAWGVWVPGDPRPPALDEGVLPAAHNYSGFDRFAMWRCEWLEPGSEQDRHGVDTAELARLGGLPGALDALAKQWLGREKDTKASRFTKSLSRPSKAAKRLGLLPEITPKVFQRVLDYCWSDVEILVHGWPYLLDFLDADLPGASEASRACNDRGIPFDADLARALLIHDRRIGQDALRAEAAALGLDPAELAEIVGNSARFQAATGLPDMTKDTIEDVFKGVYAHMGPRVECFARARQAIASIARGKLQAGIDRVSPDGMLRDQHRYIGAHTWRDSHKGMQTGNIPRPSDAFEKYGAPQIDALVQEAHDLRAPITSDAITSILLRATLHAGEGCTFAVCDFSGVEARGLAWVANDLDAVDVFTSGKDVYRVMAARIFGRARLEDVTKVERTVGKEAELMLGYGAGHEKFDSHAALKLKKKGIEGGLEAMGVDALAVVNAWRELHWPIKSLWREFERACVGALQGGPGTEIEIAGGLFVALCSDDGRALAVRDPAGLLMVYRDAHLVEGKYGPQIKFRGGVKGWEYTYGGKLVENAIQRLCRHLMMLALVRAERMGLRPVLRVHDELVCRIAVTPEAYAQAEREHGGPLGYAYDSTGASGLRALEQAMLELPPWAEGFPIGASGHIGERYRK